MKYCITLDFLDHGVLTKLEKRKASKELQKIIAEMFEAGNGKRFFRQQNRWVEVKVSPNAIN